MSREWKPGDVAIVTFGDWTIYPGLTRVVMRTERQGWVSAVLHKGSRAVSDAALSDARPLVVIDPEDRELVKRLWSSYVTQTGQMGNADDLQAALREFANPTPPKPDEPTGLGAVVEDAEGDKWVRVEMPHPDDPPWFFNGRDNDACSCHYGDLGAVRVLSEGVTP